MYEHDMQLPYDRCIEIDKEVDTLLEEEKKKQQINERKAKLIEDSKKSRHFTIYKWLGWNFILEYLSGCVLFVILFIPVMFVLLVLGLSVWELFSWGSSPLDKTVAFFTILLCAKGIAENLMKSEDK